MYKGVDLLNYMDDLSVNVTNEYILIINVLKHLNYAIRRVMNYSKEDINIIDEVEVYYVTSGSALEIYSICNALIYRVHEVKHKWYMIWITVILSD